MMMMTQWGKTHVGDANLYISQVFHIHDDGLARQGVRHSMLGNLERERFGKEIDATQGETGHSMHKEHHSELRMVARLDWIIQRRLKNSNTLRYKGR